MEFWWRAHLRTSTRATWWTAALELSRTWKNPKKKFKNSIFLIFFFYILYLLYECFHTHCLSFSCHLLFYLIFCKERPMERPTIFPGTKLFDVFRKERPGRFADALYMVDALRTLSATLFTWWGRFFPRKFCEKSLFSAKNTHFSVKTRIFASKSGSFCSFSAKLCNFFFENLTFFREKINIAIFFGRASPGRSFRGTLFTWDALRDALYRR